MTTLAAIVIPHGGSSVDITEIEIDDAKRSTSPGMRARSLRYNKSCPAPGHTT